MGRVAMKHRERMLDEQRGRCLSHTFDPVALSPWGLNRAVCTTPHPPTRSCWCFGVPYRITSLKRTQLLLALCLLTRDKERCLLLQAMTDYEPSAASYERRPETERGILHLFLAKKHCCSAGLSPQPWQPRKLPSQPLYQPLCRWNTVIDSASLCSSYPWAIGLHFVCPRSQSAYG